MPILKGILNIDVFYIFFFWIHTYVVFKNLKI